MPARKPAPRRQPATRRAATRPSVAGAAAGTLARAASGGAVRAARIVAARPALFGSAAVFAVLAGLVGDNALNRQAGRHPHPMLATRGVEAPARRPAPVRQALAPAPAPRIENDPRIRAFPLVSEVQTLLASAGYYKLPVDGRAGQATDLAIRAFQSDRGLRVDGMATPLLLTQLRQAGEGANGGAASSDEVASLIGGTDPEPTGAVMSDASTGAGASDLVRRIQGRLAAARIADVQADGILGEQTRAAIRTFEALEGLEPTGEPSAALLGRLEATAR